MHTFHFTLFIFVPEIWCVFYFAFFCPARRHGKCFSNIELMETVCGNFYIFTSGFSCKVFSPLFFMFIIWWHDLRVHRANFTCKFMWLPLNPLNSNGWQRMGLESWKLMLQTEPILLEIVVVYSKIQLLIISLMVLYFDRVNITSNGAASTNTN